MLVVVRGDHRLNEIKLQNALGAPFRPAEAEEVASLFGAGRASSARSGARTEVVADEALRGLRGLVAGANEPDVHLRGVEPGRDFEPDLGRRAAGRARRHAPPTARRSTSSRRSRSGTSSSSAPASPSPWAPATWTRRAASS